MLKLNIFISNKVFSSFNFLPFFTFLFLFSFIPQKTKQFQQEKKPQTTQVGFTLCFQISAASANSFFHLNIFLSENNSSLEIFLPGNWGSYYYLCVYKKHKTHPASEQLSPIIEPLLLPLTLKGSLSGLPNLPCSNYMCGGWPKTVFPSLCFKHTYQPHLLCC